ncbi:uncharacterized protein (DUF924 family) [Pseudomonas sp. TE3786]
MSAPWQPLLDWWFGPGETAVEVASTQNTLWFGKRDSQDDYAREHFAPLVRQALAGELEAWSETAEGWLALILLLDQLPRMIYRDSPFAYSGDIRAQQLVARGLAAGWEQALAPLEQVFVYLVLEHAENLDSQNLAIELFGSLLEQISDEDRPYFLDYLDYAERHQRVIARFGRFPHRNQALGRGSTVEEISYLKEPGSGF